VQPKYKPCAPKYDQIQLNTAFVFSWSIAK
jgi:hypothetical protein